MNETKDYELLYQRTTTPEGKKQLRAVLKTREFGPMASKLVDAVGDEKINTRLLDSLADEMIDEYEAKLKVKTFALGGIS